MLIGHNLSMQRKNIVKDGLKVWLEGKDFTNSPPTSSWRDRSGNGNNAIPSGMAYTVSSGGDNNGGITFDGVDDYLTIANSSDLDFQDGDFTIAFNVNLKTINGIQIFLCKRLSNTQNYSFDIRYNSTNIINFIYTITGASTVQLPFSCTLNINTKYRLCFRRTNGLLSLFINGVFVSSNSLGTDTIFTSTENLIIGALNSSGNKTFLLNGTLKNMLIYKNRALTDAQILQNYNATK